MRRTTEVLVVGQGKGAAAVCGEQPYDGFGNSPDGATRGMSREQNHHVAVQRSVGETSLGNLLLHHNAIKQRSRRRDGVTLQHKQLSGIHDVKNEIHAVGYSAEREGKAYGAAAGGGVGNRVVSAGKDHRISRAIGVDVSIGVRESAGPIGSKTALDGSAIVCVIETGGAKSVVPGYAGGAVSRRVRFFHGSRADRACAAGSIELDELGVAVRQHGEGQLGRAAGKIQSHHTAIVVADRIHSCESLRGSCSCYSVGVQFTVSEIAGPIRCKSSHGSINRGDASIPSEPAENKCVVAIQPRVVDRRTGRAWNWRGGARCLASATGSGDGSEEQHETQDQQQIWFTHLHTAFWLGD